MNGDPKLFALLQSLGIEWEYHEHPPAPTVDEARKYWKNLDATHCKNLFFRNHKGDRHYLVILEHTRQMSIHDLEKKLNQGKLSFGSEQRMMKYLGLTPGSVTPFGLINDKEKHVHLFIDQNLQHSRTISFHPCINTASIIISWTDFLKFLHHQGNGYEFVSVY